MIKAAHSLVVKHEGEVRVDCSRLVVQNAVDVNGSTVERGEDRDGNGYWKPA